MEDAAREARNRYKREWYAMNREKQKEYQRRYWKHKAELEAKKAEENGKENEGHDDKS